MSLICIHILSFSHSFLKEENYAQVLTFQVHISIRILLPANISYDAKCVISPQV